MRRVTILEGMFLDIATPEEKRKIDDLYRNHRKGSAVVYMLKRVRNKWIELINHKCSESNHSLSSSPVKTQGRTIKINGYGVSEILSI